MTLRQRSAPRVPSSSRRGRRNTRREAASRSRVLGQVQVRYNTIVQVASSFIMEERVNSANQAQDEEMSDTDTVIAPTVVSEGSPLRLLGNNPTANMGVVGTPRGQVRVENGYDIRQEANPKAGSTIAASVYS